MQKSAPQAGDGKAVLAVQGIRCQYGGVQAVNDVSFSMTRGESVGIIGPNGAGKSTLLDTITGLNRDYEGRVEMFGQDVTHWPMSSRAQLRMARSFQVPRMFGRMSVMSNLLVAPQNQRGESLLDAVLGTWRREDERHLERARAFLAQFGLERVQDQYASQLSGGQERLLELARALMTDPELILLDEPFAGVSPANRNRLVQHLRDLAGNQGVTLLMIEHRLEWVEQLCDRVIVMAQGAVIAEGTLAEVVRDRGVIDAYLGRRAM